MKWWCYSCVHHDSSWGLLSLLDILNVVSILEWLLQYFWQEELWLVEAWEATPALEEGVQLRNLLLEGESCFCLGRSSTGESSLERSSRRPSLEEGRQQLGRTTNVKVQVLGVVRDELSWVLVWPDTITRTKCWSSDIPWYHLRRWNPWWICDNTLWVKFNWIQLPFCLFSWQRRISLNLWFESRHWHIPKSK